MTVQISPPDYVVSPTDRLWVLSDNGDAFVWSDSGQTIAVAEHLATLCRRLFVNYEGLPSLTALLFVIDAMTQPFNLMLTKFRLKTLAASGANLLPKELEQIADWLRSVCELSPTYRIGLVPQTVLLGELVSGLADEAFEVRAVQAVDALEWMAFARADRDIQVYRAGNTSRSKCLFAAHALRHFSKRPIRENQLIALQTVGAPEVPDPADHETIELPKPECVSYNELLKSLLQDDELGQFARMAANAASTLALPRMPSDPDQLQIGGVSDITNRGQPERLLMTELAADSDLLMARIAHGEALYIRRETPPQNRAARRRVVIECGVRMWGEARLRATAVALAVGLGEERRGGTELTFFSAGEFKDWREDLKSREGIVQQLARLEPARHPGKTLMQLSKNWAKTADENAPPLLILSRKTDDDADFQRSMFDFPRPHLVITIDQQGNVELLNRTTIGDETLHRQRLALPEKVVGPKDVSHAELPLFVQISPSPLRFPSDLAARWVFIGRDSSVWLHTHSDRLLCFNQTGVGAREIGTYRGRIVASDHDIGLQLVLEEEIFDSKVVRHQLLKIDEEGCVTAIPLQSDGRTSRFEFDRGQLFRIDSQVAFIDTETGKSIATASRIGLEHVGGPFFNSDTRFYVASYEEGEIKYHNLASPQFPPALAFRYREHPVIYDVSISRAQMLDGVSNEQVRTGASIVATSLPRVVMLHPATRVAIVEYEQKDPSAFGGRSPHSGKEQWLKVDYTLVTPIDANYAAALAALDSRAAKLVSGRAIRNRLQGIAVRGERILLFRNPSICFELRAERNPRRLTLQQVKGESAEGLVDFAVDVLACKTVRRKGWNLRKASLPGGDVWLDSRGLLHFRDTAQTELTLMLHDEHMAGWFSRGTVFGSRFFTGKASDQPVPEGVVEWLARFAIQCSS